MDMSMKKKRQTVARQAAARGPLPELPKELLDQLVKGPMTPTEVQDLMLAFNKAIIERAMGAEMNLHLGYPSGQSRPAGQANERNGASGKTVITDRGPVRVEVPRDRDSERRSGMSKRMGALRSHMVFGISQPDAHCPLAC